MHEAAGAFLCGAGGASFLPYVKRCTASHHCGAEAECSRGYDFILWRHPQVDMQAFMAEEGALSQ
jgi:hypothetical protein